MTATVRRGIVLNPFYALFILYFVANLVSLTTLLLGNPIIIEIEEFSFSGGTIAISALALFSSLFAALFVYKAVLFSTKTRSNLSLCRSESLALALIQLSFLAFNTYYGINVAGVEDEVKGNAFFRVMYSIIQPDLIFLILSIGIRSNRWFWINTTIYGTSLLMRSWIGGLYLIAVIVSICEYPIVFSTKTLRYIAVLLVVGLSTLPLITSIKWFIRSGAGIEDALAFLREIGYGTYLADSLYYVLNRFQHLGHVALIAENSKSLNDAYESGAFIPYWMDAAPQWLFMRLNDVDILTVNKFIVRYIFYSDNLAYATNPGIAGWFFILQYKSAVLFIYLLLITLIPIVLVLRYAGFKYFLLINCFGLIYLFHGWIGAYANMILYLVAFLLLRRLLVGDGFSGRMRLAAAGKLPGSIGMTGQVRPAE